MHDLVRNFLAHGLQFIDRLFSGDPVLLTEQAHIFIQLVVAHLRHELDLGGCLRTKVLQLLQQFVSNSSVLQILQVAAPFPQAVHLGLEIPQQILRS